MTSDPGRLPTAILEGATVRRCVAYEHHLGEHSELLSIALVLADDDTALSLKCHSDGQSLRIAVGAMRTTSLGEQGEIVASADHAICRVLHPGARLTSVEALVDRDGLRMGLWLRTDDGQQLYVVNWGDKLLAADDLPAYIRDEINAGSGTAGSG